jgi:hypothetical protein
MACSTGRTFLGLLMWESSSSAAPRFEVMRVSIAIGVPAIVSGSRTLSRDVTSGFRPWVRTG